MHCFVSVSAAFEGFVGHVGHVSSLSDTVYDIRLHGQGQQNTVSEYNRRRYSPSPTVSSLPA